MKPSPIVDFREGLLFWARGWTHILRSTKMIRLALTPLFLSLVAVVVWVLVMCFQLPGWVQNLIEFSMGLTQGWKHDLLYYPIVLGGMLGVMVTSIYFLYLIQSILAVPFYVKMTALVLPKKSRQNWNLVHMLSVGALKMALYFALGFILFIFSFLPILNLLATFFAMLILAYDCLDYTFEARGMGLRQRVFYMKSEWVQWLGMATGLTLTLIVPGLTLLIIPGAVVGSALIVKDH